MLSKRQMVTASATKVMPWLRYEKEYLYSIGGILKIVQSVLGLSGFLSITLSDLSYHPHATWYYFVCLFSFWVSLVTLLCYAFHLVEKFHSVPWLRMELAFSCCWSVLYLSAAGLCVSRGDLLSWVAASVFAFLGMSCHAWEAALKFRDVRRRGIAQGQRKVATPGGNMTKY